MFITQVCQALHAAKIDYAIVGGYAVSLHGAVRGTVDLDLVISLTQESFVGAEKVFLQLGLVPRLPVNAKQVFEFREEYIKNKNLIAWSFHDPDRPIRQADVIITEDLRKLKSEKINLHGTKINLISIDSLIEMKKKSARPQDIEDVKALERILDEKK